MTAIKTHVSRNYRVTIAGKEDVGALSMLMRAFYSEFGFPLEDTRARSAFLELLRKPSWGAVWLACVKGTPVGYIVLSLRYTMETGSLSGYIDDLFVKSEHRRKGIARALLTELVDTCEKRGCQVLFVEANETSSSAMAFYSSFGLKRLEDGRVMLRRTIETRIDHV